MKRFFIMFLTLLLVFSTVSWALTFSDVDTYDWFYKDVTSLTQEGIINGFGDGTFRPNDSINVDQFIKLIVSSLGYNFPVNESYWAQPFINKAYDLELIDSGEFQTFNRAITRGEMASIIVKALDHEYDNQMYEYRYYMKDFFVNEDKDVLAAYYLGIISGYPNGNFYADRSATRAEASTMLMRMRDETRRIESNQLLDQEVYLMGLNRYYLQLREAYLQVLNEGYDFEPYEFDNGDLMYDSGADEIDMYVWDNGDRFIGEINDGEYGGIGLFIWSTGAQYIGDFLEGQRTGEGVMIFDDAKYTGDFVNGEMTGQGMVRWDDGFRFVGEYYKGSVNGLGKEYYPSGDYYIGYFDDGVQEGMGMYTYEDGLVYSGVFRDNALDYDDFTMHYRQLSTSEFDQKIDAVLDSVIEVGMDDNEKIKAIHDYLLLNVTYDQEAFDQDTIPQISHTAYGALISEVAVCDGYASAFNLLLNKVGIESDMVFGEAKGEGHAWNYVEFEEGYYYVDVTWDDGDDGKLRYDYYKKTLKQMDFDHSITEVSR